jgi:AcrR family transcriptional regulator
MRMDDRIGERAGNSTTLRARRPRRRSRISDERRRDLIDAAIRSISEVGYNEVTVQSICEAAGFSRGLIGHYFTGKDELLLEAVRQVARELGDAMRAAIRAAGPDPYDRLHAVVRASFTPPGFTPEKASVWVALTGTARWSPSLAEIYRSLWRSYRQGIARQMTRVAEQRGVSIDADRAALMFTQMVEGFWVGWTADPVAIEPDAAEVACHAFLDLLLRRPTATDVSA